MAEVFRAVDMRLGRSVAVKVFRAGTDLTGRRRFEEEARLLAGLAHPGLVTVYDAGTADGELFLVMQLVEGHTLAERIGQSPLPVPQALQLGRQLAEVLAYVHGSGIVHRDVKPSNVLLSADGRGFLADFGISRLVDAAGRMTATGAAVGTLGYMAPEQVRGDETGPALDVYALGLVLLECATGRPEYPGNSAEAAVVRLTRPPRIPADLPSSFAEAVRSMTAMEPQRRPTASQCVPLLSDSAAATVRAAPAPAAGGARATDADTIPGTRIMRPGAAEHPPTGVASRPDLGKPRRPWRGSCSRGVAEITQAIRHRDRSCLGRDGRVVLAAVVGGLSVLAIALILLAFGNTAAVQQPPRLPPVHQPPGPGRLSQDLTNLERAVHG